MLSDSALLQVAWLWTVPIYRRSCRGVPEPISCPNVVSGTWMVRGCPICPNLHDAEVPIRNPGLSAMLPKIRIGRFATLDATLIASNLACTSPKTNILYELGRRRAN